MHEHSQHWVTGKSDRHENLKSAGNGWPVFVRPCTRYGAWAEGC